MSCMEYTFKIGIGIPELLGRTPQEQYDFLYPIFGEDLEVDKNKNGEITFVFMETREFMFKYDILFFVIKESIGESFYSSILLSSLNLILSKIEEKLNRKLSSDEVRIFSGAWYNGIDEPCVDLWNKWKEEL